MLKGHEYFHSTPFSKKSKNPYFWAIFDHFWSFLPEQHFSKKN